MEINAFYFLETTKIRFFLCSILNITFTPLHSSELKHSSLILPAASIMTGSSGMHGGGGGVSLGGLGPASSSLNGIKLEGVGGANGGSAVSSALSGNSSYYCNSYTPPGSVEHGLLSTAYSELLPNLLRKTND